MCGSMADIQSPTTEIRQGKKKEEERKKKPQDEIIIGASIIIMLRAMLHKVS